MKRTYLLLAALTLATVAFAATSRPATRYAEPVQGYTLQTNHQQLIQRLDAAIVTNTYYLQTFGGYNEGIRNYFQGRIDGFTSARAMALEIGGGL